MQTITSSWTAARAELRARRQRRAAQQQLLRELASYTTPADRYELDAMIARAPEGDSAEIERLVSRLRAA